MAEGKPRRIRPRLAIELEPEDAELVRRVRVLAVQRRMTLREAVLVALVDWVSNDG